MPRAPRKAKIPKALREAVWRTVCGDAFSAKCPVTWCKNTITVFDFEVGHNIPESKGGTLDIHNLRPICGRCNTSMGNRYTIDEWCLMGLPTVNGAPKEEIKQGKPYVHKNRPPLTVIPRQIVTEVPLAESKGCCC